MDARMVEFDPQADHIRISKKSVVEDWVTVCERFDNDVHRVRDAQEHEGYNALYACYDEENRCFYYLVQEDAKLQRIRKKVFWGKLGRKV